MLVETGNSEFVEEEKPQKDADVENTAATDDSVNEKEEKSKTKKATKKKNSAKKPESCIEVETVVDDGYDGYYDDIHPIDDGHEREGVDKELVKKIAIIIGVLFVVIAACVALMYVL